MASLYRVQKDFPWINRVHPTWRTIDNVEVMRRDTSKPPDWLDASVALYDSDVEIWVHLVGSQVIMEDTRPVPRQGHETVFEAVCNAIPERNLLHVQHVVFTNGRLTHIHPTYAAEKTRFFEALGYL